MCSRGKDTAESVCVLQASSHTRHVMLLTLSLVTGESEPGMDALAQTARAGPHGGHSRHGRAEITLHAWISPEEAAVYLVQGHGDRKVDRRGFRCQGHMDARPWKHCKRYGHNLRVGRDEATDCSWARPILPASCPLCSEDSRNKVVSFIWETWEAAWHCVLY